MTRRISPAGLPPAHGYGQQHWQATDGVPPVQIARRSAIKLSSGRSRLACTLGAQPCPARAPSTSDLHRGKSGWSLAIRGQATSRSPTGRLQPEGAPSPWCGTARVASRACASRMGMPGQLWQRAWPRGTGRHRHSGDCFRHLGNRMAGSGPKYLFIHDRNTAWLRIYWTVRW